MSQSGEIQVVAEAFVTLVFTDSYVLGALVLGHSIRKAGTTKQLVCLVSTGLSLQSRIQLHDVFDLLVNVEEIDSRDQAHLSLLGRPELGATFTKIHAWSLTQYDRCVFLDADTLVVAPIDDIFDRDVEFAAAPDIGWPDCFNSGVFLFTPSLATHASLLELAATEGSFDGGDQGLLNTHFSTWASGDSACRLSFTYNMTANASYGYTPAYEQFKEQIKVIHFIGAAKPWQGMPMPGPGMAPVVALVEQWWRMHDDFVSCCSSSASYKTITNVRPSRSPGPELSVMPPVPSSFSGPPSLSGSPTKQSTFLESAGATEIEQLIDAQIKKPQPLVATSAASAAPAAPAGPNQPASNPVATATSAVQVVSAAASQAVSAVASQAVSAASAAAASAAQAVAAAAQSVTSSTSSSTSGSPSKKRTSRTSAI